MNWRLIAGLILLAGIWTVGVWAVSHFRFV